MSPVASRFALSRRAIAPIEVRRFAGAYRQGQQAVVRRDADALAVSLSASPLTRGWVPFVVLLHGATLADADRPGDAARYLEQGLAMLEGTVSAEEVASGDHFELLLLEQYFTLGRPADGRARLTALLTPERAIETRFGAERVQARLATWSGRYEQAHHHLNTAAGLANRIRSNFFGDLVQADRAVLLITQGSPYEAAAVANAVLPGLLRPARSARQRWANAEGASAALTISRYSANLGDRFSAGRFFGLAEPVVAGVGRRALDGLSALTRGAYAREVGDTHTAEAALAHARTSFNAVGCAHGLAMVGVDQARLGASQGLYASARPLAVRSVGELRELGLARELLDAQTLGRSIDAALARRADDSSDSSAVG